ncbi:SorU family sulfite dehydrogenase c-type cytochrome subunit [Methylobacterium sp. A54F]
MTPRDGATSAARALALLAGLLVCETASADPARLELGKRVFTEISEPRCGACHTLADAGTTGDVGPVLDGLKPDAARVAAAVSGGIGVMPAFEDLTPEQIEAVALYVATVAGKAK